MNMDIIIEVLNASEWIADEFKALKDWSLKLYQIFKID